MFLRLFVMQAVWNNRTMIGHGFAYALLPVLKWLNPGPEELREAVARHVTHFNAHPYLAPLAVGAVTRLEVEGQSHDKIAHFKTAIRGPLGGLGDRLVWIGWLPSVSLLALVCVAYGATPWATLAVFLIVFNLGHLGLRAWSVAAGYEAGLGVAARLRAARLDAAADRLRRVGALILGVVLGLVAAEGVRVGLAVWLPLAALLFLAGNLARRKAWRPAALATAILIAGIAAVGGFS